VTEPDWERMKELQAERLALQDAGRWTRAEYERLFAEMTKAVHGHGQFLESLQLHADPAWLK
jgi:hypothetical protein